MNNKKKLEKKDKTLLGVLAALIVIVIGAGAFLIVRNTNAANEQAKKLLSPAQSETKSSTSKKISASSNKSSGKTKSDNNKSSGSKSSKTSSKISKTTSHNSDS